MDFMATAFPLSAPDVRERIRRTAMRKMTPHFLSYDDARNLLDWRDAVDTLRAGHLLPRAQIHDSLIGPADALLLNRTARIEGMGFGMKVESVFSANSSKGLPATHGVVLV
jgi:ornithine cyclodeaminase